MVENVFQQPARVTSSPWGTVGPGPMAHPQATLVDLLDRVLERGLVINADIIISLAGVPLVGINLRAALAGMETMVRYGVMTEWDRSVRAQALESRGIPEGRVAATGMDIPDSVARQVPEA